VAVENRRRTLLTPARYPLPSQFKSSCRKWGAKSHSYYQPFYPDPGTKQDVEGNRRHQEEF
jgi:hypothetical protein